MEIGEGSLNSKITKAKHQLFIMMLSIVVGLLGGIGAYGVKLLISYFKKLFWGNDINFLTILNSFHHWEIILVPTIGGLLVGPIIYWGAKEAKGHGVPEVMEALILKGGRIRERVAFIKALASSITLSTGGAVGREGPIVQIGSSLASTVAQWFKVEGEELKVLVGAGAASGISAAFNAPIAGALFATEVILGNFAISSFAPIIISSVMGNIALIVLEGKETVFKIPPYTLNSVWEIGIYFVLGLFAGIIGILFIKTLYFFEKKWAELKIHEALKPAIGGLIIGIIAIKFPHIMGSGYEAIDLALEGELLLKLAVLLIFIKIFATSTTLSSGGSGGIFAPSLFMGAYLGYFVGKVSSNFFPSLGISPGAYALVGMGGVVASAIQAPLTAIIIIFELTGDYSIILPLMVTCIIASTVSEIFNEYSIYTLKLKLKGIVVKEGLEVNVLRNLRVKDILSEDFSKIKRNEKIKDLLKKALYKNINVFHVVDKNDNYVGSITLEQIKVILEERETFEEFLIADDLALPIETLSLHTTLEDAMRIFGKRDIAELPVVENKKIIGVIKRKDLIEIYNKEIQKKEATKILLSKIKFKSASEIVEIFPGYYIKETKAPPFICGKKLKEAELRSKYGIDVILIKRNKPPQVIPLPGGNEIIKEEDVLIIAGEEEKIVKFEKKDLIGG